MAKRKRLSPAALTEAPPETKAALGWVGHGTRRPPIADVTGDAAEQSAFEEVAGELRRARTEGRMVLSLPLEAVDATHMIRDRVVLDAEEMAVLKNSLRARGQQTPIEVLDLGQGRYGLISGWRRLTALQALLQETGEDRFKTINALLRMPQDVGASYLAMVEENEIRADLSFYERARIAVQAARAGVFSDTHTAVQSLFSAARAPKRSKIMAFTHLVEQLDADLCFPAAIPEKVGLALVAELQANTRFRHRLREALRKADLQDAQAERKVLDASLKAHAASRAKTVEEIAHGVKLEAGRGRITLTGANVNATLEADLRCWLLARGRAPSA
ncbi:ParB/RepB/Spo0J family partition protein [Roseobacter litoralis]|uniref:ParB/RepB/Spo0J family partition protein n=1 Tax=Roseobacter litoralis TaxID=42443 RepID=UPI00248F89E5|nr:ParB N-terminal domain-containing protein [Roseobacter litoralis]